MLIEKAL